MMQCIDLSTPLEKNDGEIAPYVMKQMPHRKGGDSFGKKFAFGKKPTFLKRLFSIGKYLLGIDRISHKTFPGEEFLNLEIIEATTHTGTHLDAPFHYGSTSEGKKAMTVDNIPLDWCFRDGVVLDLSHKKDEDIITAEDIKKSLNAIRYTLKPFDIVLIRTDASKNWGKKPYFFKYPGIAGEAIEFILEHGVKIVGVDTYGIDRPFHKMIGDYKKTKDNAFLWPSHFLGREKSYCHIERLCNLDKLPKPFGFKIACFPVKITGAGAAWTRTVALY